MPRRLSHLAFVLRIVLSLLVPFAAMADDEDESKGSAYGNADAENGTITVTVSQTRTTSSPRTSQPQATRPAGAGGPGGGGGAAAPTGAPTHCVASNVEVPPIECPTAPPLAPAPGAPAVVDVGAAARQAVARLTLPEVNARVGPDPSLNPWRIVAVGYPIWLWADSPDRVATTVTEQGITIQITAVRTGATFDMGNGDVVRCRSMTAYNLPLGTYPPKESPDCGYRYPRLPKQVGAGFDMTATTEWTVTWEALGQSGTIPVTRSQTRNLPVGELQSVVVATRR